MSASVDTVTNTTLTASFKEAGLGGETISVALSATVECINGGSKHPKASNKESVGTPPTPFTVHNGQASGTLTIYATALSCSPPMTIAWTDVVVHDYTNGISQPIPGTFYPTA